MVKETVKEGEGKTFSFLSMTLFSQKVIGFFFMEL
jgi:hypothetical protein